MGWTQEECRAPIFLMRKMKDEFRKMAFDLIFDWKMNFDLKRK